MTTVERTNVITITPGEPFRVEREWAVFLHWRGRSLRGDGWIELDGKQYRALVRRFGVSGGRQRFVGSSSTLEGAAKMIARRLYPWVLSWRIYESDPGRAHA